MKVFLTIWILAVLIQEVISSTLVRLPRHAEKNLSLVHTEYEAKYEQKGKHGNGSYSSVSGKQQIVHDNCAQDWNSFAEKCALLIKDLVASLANAVSSTPGDATNLQLHIKNTFRHFDNTHNCTCLNHTEKTLPDLNLTPLFKNITVSTVGPGSKTDAESESGAEKDSMKCGGNNQSCDGGSGSDTEKDKNIMPKTNTVGGDKNGFHQKHIKENNQPVDKLFDEHDDEPQTGHFVKRKLTKEPKQQNHALIDSEDLDMNPENAESSNLLSTNNNRRQIKNPQEISKSSGGSNFKHLANNLKHSSPNPKHPKGVHHPFLVTARPNPHPNEPFESHAVTHKPTSLTGPSLKDDFPHSPEHKPSHDLHSHDLHSHDLHSHDLHSHDLHSHDLHSHDLHSQKHPSAPVAIHPHNSSVNSNGVPSSASHHLVSPNNEHSNPKKNHLSSASQAVTKPHSSFYNEKDPKKGFSSHNPKSHQSPKIISGDPFAKDYNSEPKVLSPAKSGSNELHAHSPVEDQPIYNSKSETEALPEPFGGDLNAQLKRLFLEKPESQALNPAHTLIEELEDSHKLMPLVKPPEEPILTVPNLRPPMDVLNPLSPTILPEESLDDDHVSKSGFIPAEQFKKGVDEIVSPITKSSKQPDIATDSSPMVSDNYNLNKNLAATTPAVPVESAQSVAFPGELSLPKTVKPESSGLIPEKTGNHHDSESPSFNKIQKPIEDIAKEWLQFTTPKAYELDKTSAERSTKLAVTVTMPEEDQEALKKLPSAIKSNKNFPHLSKPESDVVTLNPSPVYKPSSADSNSNPLSDTVMLDKDPAILSPEDILPIGDNGQLFSGESTTPEYDQTTGHNLGHTISTVKPVSTVPEVVNQQSETLTPVEKQLHDKSSEPIVPESQITGHPTPKVPKSTFPQNPLFNAQNPDTETVSSSMGKIHHSKQSVQEEMFTTPLPFQAAKTVIPAIGHPEVAKEDPESNGKDFTVTEIPTASNIPVVSITKDQEKQPNTAGSLPQSGEQVKTSVVAPEIAVTTPVIVYPLKYFPISPEESPEQSYQESSHPVLANNDLSDSKEQTLLFTTPVPLSSVKPIQAAPGTAEQQNSNAGSPMQPTATTENCSTSDSPNEQEHPFGNSAPVRESGNVQHPEVMDKPDKSTSSNFHHHSQSGTDSNSHTSSTYNPESHLETSVPPTGWKPAQPGALIHNNEAHPHQINEQNPLLIQPTTFQTTSEDPTPSQVNVSGLLTRTTSIPLDSDETVPVRPSTSPKTTSIYEHDDDDEEDCCSCESCTEEEITDPKQYKETACKDLEEARKELKAIFDKIKKKLKCGRKGPQTITSS